MSKLLDLDVDVVAAVEANVPASVSGREILATLDATEAWNAYRAWRWRFISKRPRTVHLSRELQADLQQLPTQEAAAIWAVLKEIKRGDDLTVRLSKLTRHFHDPRGRNDRDRMLNDWGVHHLHLGPRIDNQTPVERSGPLLFVSVLEDDAYAAIALPHGNWADEDVLRVLADNWPDEGVIHGTRGGIVGLSPSRSR